MKKSSIVVIFIIYIASIVAIGFFGMSLKIYGEDIKYIKSVEMSVEVENKDMCEFTFINFDDSSKNPVYSLIIYFEKALVGTFEEDGMQVEKRYLPLTFIPKITYDTGDEGSTAEGIIYSLNRQSQKRMDRGDFSLEQNGTLIIFGEDFSFDIIVTPATKGGIGTGAIIQVDVIGGEYGENNNF